MRQDIIDYLHAEPSRAERAEAFFDGVPDVADLTDLAPEH